MGIAPARTLISEASDRHGLSQVARKKPTLGERLRLDPSDLICRNKMQSDHSLLIMSYSIRDV